jgi:hypothetical protein
MKNLIISAMLFLSSCVDAYEYEISMCAIFQNEARFLKEWIEYHEKQGVEHFYLYNNNSTDDYKTVLKPYIKRGLVELIEWPSSQEANEWANFSFTVQPNAYNDAIAKAKRVSKWLCINDTDEFILPIKNKDLRAYLKHKEKYKQIRVKWINFGTSHIQKIADKTSMLAQLTLRSKDDDIANDSYKSIVQPKYVETCNHPHFCIMKANSKELDALREEIRINHYWTRDNEFLMNVKVARYKKWGSDPSNILKRAAAFNEVYDDLMLKHLKKHEK